MPNLRVIFIPFILRSSQGNNSNQQYKCKIIRLKREQLACPFAKDLQPFISVFPASRQSRDPSHEADWHRTSLSKSLLGSNSPSSQRLTACLSHYVHRRRIVLAMFGIGTCVVLCSVLLGTYAVFLTVAELSFVFVTLTLVSKGPFSWD